MLPTAAAPVLAKELVHCRFRCLETLAQRSDYHMQVVVPHSHDVGLEDFEVFESQLALTKRINGLSTISTFRLSPSGECHGRGNSLRSSQTLYKILPVEQQKL